MSAAASLLVALALVFLGAPQTLRGAMEATDVGRAKQTIAIGPVASQEAIKLLGDNAGGFFNANSAHPFENPGALSNMIESWSQLVVPVALLFAFGRMVGDRRQSYSLFAVMSIIFLVSVATLYHVEAAGNPLLTELGVDPVGGSLEGKDLRFGQTAPPCSRSRPRGPEPAPLTRRSTRSCRSAASFRWSIC